MEKRKLDKAVLCGFCDGTGSDLLGTELHSRLWLERLQNRLQEIWHIEADNQEIADSIVRLIKHGTLWVGFQHNVLVIGVAAGRHNE